MASAMASARTIAFGVHCHHGGNDALAEEVAVDCALWLNSNGGCGCPKRKPWEIFVNG